MKTLINLIRYPEGPFYRGWGCGYILIPIALFKKHFNKLGGYSVGESTMQITYSEEEVIGEEVYQMIGFDTNHMWCTKEKQTFNWVLEELQALQWEVEKIVNPEL